MLLGLSAWLQSGVRTAPFEKLHLPTMLAHGCACCVYSLIPWYSKKYKELISAGTKTSHLLLMNGCDHTAPDAQ